MKRILCIFLFLTFCASCSEWEPELDQKLQGSWNYEGHHERFNTLIFKGERFGINKLDERTTYDGTKAFATYSVDKGSEPHKIFLIAEFKGKKTIFPFGIYKISEDIMTFCPTEDYKQVSTGFPSSKTKEALPESFSKDCLTFKKSS